MRTTVTTNARTTCPYCGVGCGVVARMKGNAVVGVRGDPEHPANKGRLCVKGGALHETAGCGGRLLYPTVGGRRVGWEQALDTVAAGIRRIQERHGPEAVAFYLSGQILTEDYYVANKLIKGFIGTGNVDTNSRLCMATSVAAHKLAFGSDSVPGCYEDLEIADLVVLVGSNAAWTHPVLYQRIARARIERPGMRVLVIDPRCTATCETADLHLPLKPGSDGILFSGLLAYLNNRNCLDRDYIAHHTEGFPTSLNAALASTRGIRDVAERCGLEQREVEHFYELFAGTPRTVTLFSQGINQSSSGVDKAGAILNCHLATGRIGKPGASPFSLTGQPNAMGGREVGGLANQLAAHMDFDTPGALERVRRFWKAPNMAQGPGLKAVDLFRAMADGRVKAVWIMGTNPLVSLPDADAMREALRCCELVVVSDCVGETDTAMEADILLPATTWGEKDGTVTNSERRISRQRPLLTAPGEARHDWWALTQIARRLGFEDAFPYRSPAEIFREHAALTGLDNPGTRDLDLSGLSDISDSGYDAMEPVQWPVTKSAPAGTKRLFGDGRFFTPNGRARFLPSSPRLPALTADEAFPLVMNTGRLRDQWHTMTRTGHTPRLMSHAAEPSLEIHPEDAGSLGLREGRLARVIGRRAEILVRVLISRDVKRGSVFVPMHWNERFASRARVGALINAITDPISGQPEFKQVPVRVEPYEAAWFAFLIGRNELAPPPVDYWARIPVVDGVRYELAGAEDPGFLRDWLETAVGREGEWLEYGDSARGAWRKACVREGRLDAVLFASPSPDLPARDWLSDLFRRSSLAAGERRGLLAGRGAVGQPDKGPIVCSCHQVGRNTIADAIAEGIATPEALGAKLRCGTNCGSCVPELRRLIGMQAERRAAA